MIGRARIMDALHGTATDKRPPSQGAASVEDAVDYVNAPPHYTYGRFETVDVIADALGKTLFEGFCVGNVIKYVLRYRRKNGLEDLKKARWYLDKVISVMEEGA